MKEPSIQSKIITDIKQLFLNTNNSIKVLCILIIFGYLISFIKPLYEQLIIQPGKLLPPNFAIWSLFTYSLLESHIWLVPCSITLVIIYGKLVEPLWGTIEMIRFFFILSIVVGILTTFCYNFLYLFTRNTDLLFSNGIEGMAAYAAGLTVIIKQIMGDQILISHQFGKLRNKHIPCLFIIVALSARLLKIVEPPYVLMVLWGILTSWIYLRFYQPHKDGIKGDSTSAFSFSSFFPACLSPALDVLSNSVFALLVKMRLCNKIPRKFAVQKENVIPIHVTLDSHDAERRRQLALKALNERLNRVGNLAWESLDSIEEVLTPQIKNESDTIPLDNNLSTNIENNEIKLDINT